VDHKKEVRFYLGEDKVTIQQQYESEEVLWGIRDSKKEILEEKKENKK